MIRVSRTSDPIQARNANEYRTHLARHFPCLRCGLGVNRPLSLPPGVYQATDNLHPNAEQSDLANSMTPFYWQHNLLGNATYWATQPADERRSNIA